MFFELFVVGGFFFWALLVIEVALLGTFIWNEKGWPASISLVALGVILLFFGDFNVFLFTLDNIGVLWKYIIGYAAIGAAWSAFKWYLFNSDVRSTLKEAKELFIEKKGIDGNQITENHMEDWRHFLKCDTEWPRGHLTYKQRTSSIRFLSDIKPKIRHYKSDAMFWITYWPISVLWAVLHDAVERIAKWTYDAIKGIFESISRMVWRGMPEDLR